jgi:hypothetical protein
MTVTDTLLDTSSILRIVRRHGLLGEEGTLVQYRSKDRNYIYVVRLDGTQVDGGWTPDRFEVAEPQPVTSPLPAGTLLRCVNNGAQERLADGAFYRLAHVEGNGQFVNVRTLDGQRVVLDDETNLFYEFMSNRFVYYPDSAPAEPTTEKGTTMSNTTTTVPLTIDVARTLPIGAVVVRKSTENYKPGERFTLDVAGIDVDGDFHGLYDGEGFASYQRWSFFDLPDTLGAPEPAPTENPLAAELAQVRRERNAFESDLERVIDALRQEAIDREWCSDYDRFMERLGFEARCSRKFTVRRRAYIEWDVEIEASDEDAAREEADNDVPSYVRDLDSDYIDLENVEIVDVEEA